MGLILDRSKVLDIFAEASDRRWVLPAFNSENLTTCEAILSGVLEYGKQIVESNLPIIIGITNNYNPRPQTRFYTKTGQWQLGLKLFLNDMKELTASGSPFENLRVMIHLDHIQWDKDRELLEWDMNQFSSIMFDASELPLDENIKKTAQFVEKNRDKIVIEGACDEIGRNSDNDGNETGLTTPDMAEQYFNETNADIIVANLGTEHRAGNANLKYHREIAREITRRIGPRLCLHGTSSISSENLHRLFDDGICKVNIWTSLERDSAPYLFQNIINNASKVVGHKKVKELIHSKTLGAKVDASSDPSIDFFTSSYRQKIIYNQMKEIVINYLKLWYI